MKVVLLLSFLVLAFLAISEVEGAYDYLAKSAHVDVKTWSSSSSNCKQSGKLNYLYYSELEDPKYVKVESKRKGENKQCQVKLTFKVGFAPLLVSKLSVIGVYKSNVDFSIKTTSKHLQSTTFDAAKDDWTEFAFDLEPLERNPNAPHYADLPTGYLGYEKFLDDEKLRLSIHLESKKTGAYIKFDKVILVVEFYSVVPKIVGPAPTIQTQLISNSLDTAKQPDGSLTITPSLLKTFLPNAQSTFNDVIGSLNIENAEVTNTTSGGQQVVVVTGTTNTIPGTDTVLPTSFQVTFAAVIANSGSSTSGNIQDNVAVTSFCFTADTFDKKIIKGFVDPDSSTRTSIWFDSFTPDFTKEQCVFISTGETAYFGRELVEGYNLFLNGPIPVLSTLSKGNYYSIQGVIGFGTEDGVSQVYDLFIPGVVDYISGITPGVEVTTLALELIDIFNLPTTVSVIGTVEFDSTITLNLVGTYTTGSPLSLTATLANCWNNPFGQTWITSICNINGNLQLDINEPTFFVSASLSATATVSFSSNEPKPVFTLVVQPNGIAFILNNLPFVGAITEIVQSFTTIPAGAKSTLDEISNAVPAIETLSFSTFESDEVKRGLYVKIPILVSGNFADALGSILPNPTSITFSLEVMVNVDEFELALMMNNMKINGNFEIVDTGFTLTIPQGPPILALQAGLQVTFSANPEPLTFYIIGSWQGRAVSITGAMTGDWVNPFGVKGFSIGEVGITLGFGPPVPPGLQSFGLTAKMTIGPKFIRFAGLVDINVPQNMFLYGNFSGEDGMAFTVGDIVTLGVNAIVLATGNEPNFDLSKVPLNWGIENVIFQIAPTNAAIGPITFQKGFLVQGGINVFGIILQIGIGSTSFNVPGIGEVPDLNFNFLLDATEFNEKYLSAAQNAILNTLPSAIKNKILPSAIEKYVQWPPPGMDFSKLLFGLNKLQLKNFGLYNSLGLGNDPEFIVEVIIFGKTFSLDTTVSLKEITMDLGDLIQDRIFDELKIPNCVWNAQCGSDKPMCDHTTNHWHCVEACSERAGSLGPDLVKELNPGCFRCNIDTDCAWTGNKLFCESGQCMSFEECNAARCSGDEVCTYFPVQGQCIPTLSAVTGAATNAASVVTSGVTSGASVVTSGVTSGVSAVTSGVTSGASAVTSGVTSGASAVTSGVTSGASAVTSGVTSGASAVTSGVTSGASAVTSGVTSGASAVTSGASSAASSIASAVGGIFKRFARLF